MPMNDEYNQRTGDPWLDLLAAIYRRGLMDAAKGDRAARSWLMAVGANDFKRYLAARNGKSLKILNGSKLNRSSSY